MRRKTPPTGTEADLKLAALRPLFIDENKAREFLETKRWPEGPVCPKCGGSEAYPLHGKMGSKSPVRPGVFKCKLCRSQFTVRTGTVFEESKIPLRKWLMAVHLMTSSRKGVSSHQMARELGITQKSGWFLCYRIRGAMRQEPLASMRKYQAVVRERFDRLVAEWKAGRGHSSKLKDLAMHPAYQQVIGMGEDAIPLLLAEMKERPDQWDWALRAITGIDPVPRTSWGKLREIVDAWIHWGKEEGYIG